MKVRCYLFRDTNDSAWSLINGAYYYSVLVDPARYRERAMKNMTT